MKWSRKIKRDPNPSRKDIEDSLDKLDRSGVVMEHSDGGIYLDVDNDYVWNCVEVAKEYGYELPPFFDEAGGEGAHVKIAEEFEIKKKGKKAEEDVLSSCLSDFYIRVSTSVPSCQPFFSAKGNFSFAVGIAAIFNNCNV